MNNRAELYKNIRKFYREEAEPVLRKYEKERKEDLPVIIAQHVCFLGVVIGIFGCIKIPALFILAILSVIALLVFYKISKNERIKTISHNGKTTVYLDIEADYEISIKRILMPKFLQIFEENLEWHKHDDEQSPILYEDLLLDKLEIFTQTCSITFDDIIYGHDLEVPTDIIETRAGLNSKNTSKMGLVLFLAFLAIPAVPIIFTILMSKPILFCAVVLFILFLKSKKSTNHSQQNLILRFKIPKHINAHTIIFEKGIIFNPKNTRERFEKVTLEDIKFEKNFDTYSTNQVEARYLLTTAFMTKFKELELSFKAKNIRAEFTGKELIILLQVDKDMFQMGNITKETSLSTFLEMANEICSVLAISKQLNLDSKTGL